MGMVVRFQPRDVDAAAKTEAVLNRIGQYYQERLKAKEALPGVLAQLVKAGETETVLRAITLWGSGEMEPHQVLSLCEQVAAVAGIKEVADRPF